MTSARMNLDACAWWHMWLNVSDIVLPQPDLKPVVIRSVNQMVAEVHRALQTHGSIFNRDVEWRIQSPQAVGSMRNVALGRNWEVTVTDLAVRQPTTFCIAGRASHAIELGFCPAGQMAVAIRGCRKDFDSIAGQSYVSAFDGDLHIHTTVGANQRFQLVEVRFCPQSFDECAACNGLRVPGEIDRCAVRQLRAPFKYATALSQEMRHAAEQVLACPFTGPTRRVYLEAKALELTALLMAWLQGDRAIRQPALSPSDVERIYAARDLLLTRIDDPPSLAELARLVCLNEFKLKRGFHQVFGKTAFGCLHQARMAWAHELLCADHSVTRAAAEVGYTAGATDVVVGARAALRHRGHLGHR